MGLPHPPSIADRCAQLEARGALRFRPSLSWAVYDALFSFWRLPRETRRALGLNVPRFAVDNGSFVGVDWSGVLETVQSVDDVGRDSSEVGHNRIHVAWTLAHHAEAAFDELVTSETVASETVVHATTVHRLLVRLHVHHGDFYMTFLVLITVLEKALYDLYHHHHQRSGTTETKKKNMILRDLLHSTVLQLALPSGMMELLKILFLPSGLNLRNLVWHGFVVPAQFARCFACLTAMLLFELPRYFPPESAASDTSALFQLHAFDDRFLVPTEVQDAFTETLDLRGLLSLATDASEFIPRGREGVVRRAVDALINDNDELWFLFALLPVLEHAIRVQFVRSNSALYGLALEDFGVAQIDQYYSTLDGFGQRGKHQLLLHSELAGYDDSTMLNALYRSMPHAPLAVSLDLFMMAAGPNVRAKLCHGEADLSTLLAGPRDGEPRKLSMITQLLVLTWVSLCHTYDYDYDQSKRDSKRPRLAEQAHAISLFEASMGSSFHPFVSLRRLTDVCVNRLQAFESLRKRWANPRAIDIDAGECDSADRLTQLEFLSCESGNVVVAIVDKASRIQEFKCFFDRTATPATPVKKPKSFVELLVALDAKVGHALARLHIHNDASHPPEPRTTTTGSYARCLLALSDVDGLSVSACMINILSSIDRSLTAFEARLTTLVTLIQDGSARTSQRRAFLNNVFLLPVFEQVQQLAFGLVVHQIHHLETVARQRAAAIDGTSAPALCPDALKFEQLQRKLLQFITAFEGCAGSAEGAQKSSEKALQLALQFVESKALRTVVG